MGHIFVIRHFTSPRKRAIVKTESLISQSFPCGVGDSQWLNKIISDCDDQQHEWCHGWALQIGWSGKGTLRRQHWAKAWEDTSYRRKNPAAQTRRQKVKRNEFGMLERINNQSDWKGKSLYNCGKTQLVCPSPSSSKDWLPLPTTCSSIPNHTLPCHPRFFLHISHFLLSLNSTGQRLSTLFNTVSPATKTMAPAWILNQYLLTVWISILRYEELW